MLEPEIPTMTQHPLQEQLRNPLTKKGDERDRSRIVSAFPVLESDARSGCLVLRRYLDRRPERLFDKVSCNVYLDWLQERGANDHRALKKYLDQFGSEISSALLFLAGISDLLALDGTFIHPRAAERAKFCSAHNRPAPEAVTSAHADVEPTGAAAFMAFLRHRSTLVPFRRQPSLHLAARQPAGTGSAQILRSISPKSRRFRCPSASRSQ